MSLRVEMRGVVDRRRETIDRTRVSSCTLEGRSDLVPSRLLRLRVLTQKQAIDPAFSRNPDRHIGLFAYPVLPSTGNRSNINTGLYIITDSMERSTS